MKKIGIIVNLNSRKYKRSKDAHYGKLEQIGGEFAVVRYTRKIEDIAHVAKEFKYLNVDYIAPSGGDGTLHHVITQCANVYKKNLPPVLILKSGTMNNVATSINLKGGSFSILKRAIELLRKGKDLPLIERNTMEIDGNYCFLFGNGITSDFLDRYYSIGKSYTKLVILIKKTIFEALAPSKSQLFKGFDGTICFDEIQLPYLNVLGTLVGTVETVGMGFYPLFRANERHDAFHAIAFAMKPMDLLKKLIHIKMGLPIQHPLYFDKTVRSIRIVSNQPFVYTMDGDLYKSDGRLTVSIGIKVAFAVV